MAGSFVMQTPIASCLIQMSALSLSPLPHSRSTPTPLHPPSLPLLPHLPPTSAFSSVSSSFSSPSKSSLREEGASGPGAAEASLSPGGQPVSQRMGLFPGPTKSISYSNVTIRPLTHRGLFMVAAPGRRVKMVI